MTTPRGLDLPAGVQRRTLPTARGAVATLQAGPADGRPLVLVLDGTGSEQRVRDLLAHLAHQGRRVVAVDPHAADGTTDAAALRSHPLAPSAAHLLAVLDALGGQADLLGHSSGGLVATQAAVVRPTAVVSLTLLPADDGPSARPAAAGLGRELAARPVPVLVLAAEPDDGTRTGAPEELARRVGAFLDAWPPAAVVLDLPVADDTREVPAARRQVRALVADGRLPAPLLDDLELVVSELLANAVLHGSPPVRLRLQLRPGPEPVVEVDVRDAGQGCAAAGRRPGRPDHGRGVALVAAVSRRSGSYLGTDGCHAWALLSPAAA